MNLAQPKSLFFFFFFFFFLDFFSSTHVPTFLLPISSFCFLNFVFSFLAFFPPHTYPTLSFYFLYLLYCFYLFAQHSIKVISSSESERDRRRTSMAVEESRSKDEAPTLRSAFSLIYLISFMRKIGVCLSLDCSLAKKLFWVLERPILLDTFWVKLLKKEVNSNPIGYFILMENKTKKESCTITIHNNSWFSGAGNSIHFSIKISVLPLPVGDGWVSFSAFRGRKRLLGDPPNAALENGSGVRNWNLAFACRVDSGYKPITAQKTILVLTVTTFLFLKSWIKNDQYN